MFSHKNDEETTMQSMQEMYRARRGNAFDALNHVREAT